MSAEPKTAQSFQRLMEALAALAADPTHPCHATAARVLTLLLGDGREDDDAFVTSPEIHQLFVVLAGQLDATVTPQALQQWFIDLVELIPVNTPSRAPRPN